MTHATDLHCGCVVGDLSIITSRGSGCAFDGSYLYFPTNSGTQIRRVDYPGFTTNVLLHASTGGDELRWPTYNPDDGLLYWVNRDANTIESYDLSAGLGGSVTTLHSGGSFAQIHYHPTDGNLYGVRAAGGSSHFSQITTAGTVTDLVTDPPAINFFETAIWDLAITPDAVWGVCALNTSTFDGLFRWDLAGASITYFDPGIASEAPSGGLVGLRDNTIIISWFKNLGEPGGSNELIFTMDSSFTATIRCDDTTTFQSLAGILDSEAPGWAYAIYSDGTTMWRTPCPPKGGWGRDRYGGPGF